MEGAKFLKDKYNRHQFSDAMTIIVFVTGFIAAGVALIALGERAALFTASL